jgi:hypothetical protein
MIENVVFFREDFPAICYSAFESNLFFRVKPGRRSHFSYNLKLRISESQIFRKTSRICRAHRLKKGSLLSAPIGDAQRKLRQERIRKQENREREEYEAYLEVGKEFLKSSL